MTIGENMKKNGLYKLNEKGIEFLKENDCQIVSRNSKIGSRPMFFSLPYKENDDIIYLIPLSTLNNHNRSRINSIINSEGLPSNFYEKVNILGVERVLKISSVFVVSRDMVNEWTSRGTIYIVQNKNVTESAEKKLNTMLVHYSANPENSENHVIECRNKLIDNFELKEN